VGRCDPGRTQALRRLAFAVFVVGIAVPILGAMAINQGSPKSVVAADNSSFTQAEGTITIHQTSKVAGVPADQWSGTEESTLTLQFLFTGGAGNWFERGNSKWTWSVSGSFNRTGASACGAEHLDRSGSGSGQDFGTSGAIGATDSFYYGPPDYPTGRLSVSVLRAPIVATITCTSDGSQTTTSGTTVVQPQCPNGGNHALSGAFPRNWDLDGKPQGTLVLNFNCSDSWVGPDDFGPSTAKSILVGGSLTFSVANSSPPTASPSPTVTATATPTSTPSATETPTPTDSATPSEGDHPAWPRTIADFVVGPKGGEFKFKVDPFPIELTLTIPPGAFLLSHIRILGGDPGMLGLLLPPGAIWVDGYAVTFEPANSPPQKPLKFSIKDDSITPDAQVYKTTTGLPPYNLKFFEGATITPGIATVTFQNDPGFVVVRRGQVGAASGIPGPLIAAGGFAALIVIAAIVGIARSRRVRRTQSSG
jgi:hypothetical protein